MKAARFRVQNFRNIDDSGWIEIERVTAFVGRNESGKTALLKALHKFNPATPEPYDPRREFPRDRYTRDYKATESQGKNWPVCSVDFELNNELRREITEILGPDGESPNKVILTRHYDGSLAFEYTPPIDWKPLAPDSVQAALGRFAQSARRLEASDDQQNTMSERRAELARWATDWMDRLRDIADLQCDEGREILSEIQQEVESKSDSQTADMVETLGSAIKPVLDRSRMEPFRDKIEKLIELNLPVLIYFENYGILDSAIWLSRFLDDMEREPNHPKVRTINAMFRHVGLDAKQIRRLGDETPIIQRRQQGIGQTNEDDSAEKEKKEERAIQLNAASNDISRKFSEWWSQRRHRIKYSADGDFFRIWVSDDRQVDVDIELEARSKGFQWFFSFYLVFLVESNDGHRNAILLLDEPGLHLHPAGQQELIGFFETLSENNQIVYTTHSPFLIDGEHLHRVRPVVEDNAGHSQVMDDPWPADRETIFPLQAAAGYAMISGLFRHRKNVLVEGMTDFYYLHALSEQCRIAGRTGLPEDIYITPCGGTKMVSHLAALFLGHCVRPLIVLDGDKAGRTRQNALMQQLYEGHGSRIVMLDSLVDRGGGDVEIEDIVGEQIILDALERVLGSPLKIADEDCPTGSLPSRIKSAALRQKITLPDGWKATVARSLVSAWVESDETLSDAVLDNAEKLFVAITERFDQ